MYIVINGINCNTFNFSKIEYLNCDTTDIFKVIVNSNHSNLYLTESTNQLKGYIFKGSASESLLIDTVAKCSLVTCIFLLNAELDILFISVRSYHV